MVIEVVESKFWHRNKGEKLENRQSHPSLQPWNQRDNCVVCS